MSEQSETSPEFRGILGRELTLIYPMAHFLSSDEYRAYVDVRVSVQQLTMKFETNCIGAPPRL
jgi:hypothetical protein